MKKLHLVCNAHLDPVWLWPWNEGAAEAISTFRTAADFCEKYEGFVFCHNEALLYQWVEEYEPHLFERIKGLVKKGSWKIIGGWYLQPDCNIPNGESFIRQIKAGREYFYEKFGVKPETAVNFDSFGHTRGLVQILAKTGYKNYLFMRAAKPNTLFKWKGYDNSEVTALCIFGGYNSLKGEAVKNINEYMESCMNEADPQKNIYETGLKTWGIGNHGGGASVPDMEGIAKLIEETENIEIVHSDPDSFFNEVDKSNLEVVEDSLCHCMVGCYSSMIRIKQLHRKLENKIEVCKTMMTNAGIWDTEIKEAEKALMFAEFHDILPGSMIRTGEEQEIARLNYGIHIADKLIMRAFMKLCSGQKKAVDGEIPVMVYNPLPYPVKESIAFEFNLSNQNWNDGEYTYARVFDENGEELAAQNEKPECTLNLDWRKRVVFTAELKPCSMNRFDARLEMGNVSDRIKKAEADDQFITVKTAFGTVKISKENGLLTKLDSNGKVQLENAGKIFVIKDNEDPWGMTVDRFTDKMGEMGLMSKIDANSFCGYANAETENVRVIENGAVACRVQAFFKFENSVAVVTYTIPKEIDYVDVKIKILSNDVNRMYKYAVGTKDSGDFLGQTAFGVRNLEKDGREVSFQQWCGTSGVHVLNKGTYAGSFEDGNILISLIRTPVYSAHPIDDRSICEDDRYTEHIDLGEREFEYRLVCGENLPVERMAQSYNMMPEALSFFPCGEGKKPEQLAEIGNDSIIMTNISLAENGHYVRFYNSRNESQKASVKVLDWQGDIEFEPYEVKTFLYNNAHMTECDMLGEVLN
ncbi:MAG: alpha-mannosidase [Clostridia bacterium]|nr:alpha-mannosidase [Clostridia bacterium]